MNPSLKASDSRLKVSAWIGRLMLRELDGFERELSLMSDETLWRVMPGATNAVGTLVLHVCGNLQHFVGAVLGGTGYRRNREREFAARDLPREELLVELRRARDVVERVMPDLSEAQLSAEYPEAVGGVRVGTGIFLTHLAAHLAFHLGQAGYLRRMLTGDARSAGPLPLRPLADR